MIKTADIVVESFKPGYADRMGIGYEAIRQWNEATVYCSLSGYGQQGVRSQRSGHDINFMATSGLLHLMHGPAGDPVLPLFQIADIAGALHAAIAILAAVIDSRCSGQGIYLDVSIMASAKSLLTTNLFEALILGHIETGFGHYLSGQYPSYGLYRTRDNRYMALGILEPTIWVEFCRAVDREDLAQSQFPADVLESRVRGEMQEIFGMKDQREWVAFWGSRDLCCEPVMSVVEVGHEIAESVEGTTTEQHVDPVHRVSFPKGQWTLPADGEHRASAPGLGEHTLSVLEELRIPGDYIAFLRSKKVVASPSDIVLPKQRLFT